MNHTDIIEEDVELIKGEIEKISVLNSDEVNVENLDEESFQALCKKWEGK